MRGAISIVAVIGLAVASPANALGCLDKMTLTAARLHEFATLMMAVKLRCKTIGIDMSDDYDAMFAAHRAVFAAADRRLRAFFADNPRSFDAYSTRLGNRFGGGATEVANCNRFDKVARDLAAKPDAASLGKVIYKMVATPHIEGVECPKP